MGYPEGLSIIIPVGYDPIGISITLNSIFLSEYDVLLDVIVVNDGADSDVSDVCLKYNVNEICIKKNVGPALARNIAVNKAKYSSLAFIDADVIIGNDWINLMFNRLKNNDLVAGDVKINQGLVQNIFHEYDYYTAFNIESYFKNGHGVTANLGVKKEIFNYLGGFNSSLRSAEDLEFCDRLTNLKKFKAVFANDIVVFHPPRSLYSQFIKRKRVIVGHLCLSMIYKTRYLKFVKTYYNPLIMLRPPFKTIKSIYGISSYKRILFFFFAYILKLYSFLCALLFLVLPRDSYLEIKGKKKIDD